MLLLSKKWVRKECFPFYLSFSISRVEVVDCFAVEILGEIWEPHILLRFAGVLVLGK